MPIKFDAWVISHIPKLGTEVPCVFDGPWSVECSCVLVADTSPDHPRWFLPDGVRSSSPSPLGNIMWGQEGEGEMRAEWSRAPPTRLELRDCGAQVFSACREAVVNQRALPGLCQCQD